MNLAHTPPLAWRCVPRAGWPRWLRCAAASALAAAAAACSHAPAPLSPQGLPQDHLFPQPAVAAAVAAEADALLAMSAPMRRYAQSILADPSGWRDRRQTLIDALYTKSKLQLTYDGVATRTAAEAFEARAGNCLSLVLMTAAFAKHLEVPFAFQQVLVDEEFSRMGDLYFVSGHVNITLGRHGVALNGTEPHWLTIDFLPQSLLRGQRSYAIDERTVVAMFLNNRAAEALARGELSAAYWSARTALQRDPSFAPAANTLAVIYQRAGHHEPAERALRYVIEREPQGANAWSNLVRLLRVQGRHDEANAAAERLARLEPHPPFHFFEQARLALRQGDAAKARELLQQELRQQPLQHEVHFWLALTHLALGDTRQATRHLRLASDNSPTPQTQALYAAKLERLRLTRQQ